MLIKKIFITFLVLFSISSYAKNIGIVNNIQFKGLQNISKNEALKSIFLNTGTVISEYDMQNSIKLLFETSKFKNIKEIYSKKNIIFDVREAPIITDVVFTGNNMIKNSILDAYLKKLNIQKGSLLNKKSIDIFIKTLEDFYYDSGRFEASIQVLKRFSEDNTVDLKILFNEGVTKQINNIVILGAKHFSKEKLVSLFQSKDHSIWWNIFDKRQYSPQKLNQDLKHLYDFYFNYGYIDFHINEKKIDLIKDTDQLNITLNVTEGAQYHIAKMFIKGNIFPYQPLIKKLITIRANEVFNKEKISNIILNIIRLLSENGYINTTVTVDPKINYKTKTIVLHLNIDLKKRVFVHRIHFVGNNITQDKVLRREMKQMEGKYINIRLVELGKKLLQNTKYFSNVEVIKKINPLDSNQVDIFYKVQEKPTGSINFGLGYGMDGGISFNASLSKDNIFGSGNSFKASVMKNDNKKYADISISYPYFISNIKNLNTRIFYNDFKYNFNGIANVIKKTYGLESSLGIIINDFNKFTFGLGYNHNGINNTEKIVDLARVNNKAIDVNFFKNQIVNDFTLNYSWLNSTLEYLYFPISGHKIYMSGKNTIPGSNNNFYKFILDSKHYFPLDKKTDLIFFSHFHLGIANIFNQEKIPFYENFYSNSQNNIRGFRLNTIGPKRIYSDLKNCIGHINNNQCESIDSIGGNSTLTANLEIITPIPFIDQQYSKYFRPSLFLDAGNIWDTALFNHKTNNVLSFFLDNEVLNNIYSSIGLSLEWFSPIGPLVFSYAFPIQKDNNDQLEPFQFHFGKNW